MHHFLLLLVHINSVQGVKHRVAFIVKQSKETHITIVHQKNIQNNNVHFGHFIISRSVLSLSLDNGTKSSHVSCWKAVR